MPPQYRLRPGTASDLAHAVRLYDACLGQDLLVQILFPGAREHDPVGFKTHLYRIYAQRFWSVEWKFTFVVKEAGDEEEEEEEEVVGFSTWKRPKGEVGFVERWCTIFAWVAPLVRKFIALQTKLSPTVDLHAATAFDRCFPPIEEALFTAKKPKEWWYLSTLAVHPSYQGHGLGGLLMDEGLGMADAYQQKKNSSQTSRGKAWLIGLRGTDRFYNRFGFKEVGRANVGELSEWDGGLVMFRE
ncbi:hypothetical protein ACQKWADRAFT_311924 [Trichoderma austrokoningii]